MRKRLTTLGLAVLIATAVATTPVYASSLIDKPTGTGGQEIHYAESTAPNMKEISRELSETKETVNDSKWDITERDVSFRTDLNKGTTRFEVFYSASAMTPYIAFQTADGDIYESGKDTDNIVSRDGNQIPGHSDLRYEVIYITSPASTDNLTVKVSLDSKTHDFMLIKSSVPQGWEHFTQEYRTEPRQLLIWGFHNSENTITDLVAIAENVDVKPSGNDMDVAAPPVVEKKDYTGTILMLAAVLIGGILFMLFLNNRTKKRQEEEALEKRVKKKNNLSKKIKAENRKSLDSVLDEFNDDYSDDFFFNEAKPINEDDVVMPIEEKVAFVEDEEEKPEPMVDTEPVKKIEADEPMTIDNYNMKDNIKHIINNDIKQGAKEQLQQEKEEKIEPTPVYNIPKASWM